MPDARCLRKSAAIRYPDSIADADANIGMPVEIFADLAIGLPPRGASQRRRFSVIGTSRRLAVVALLALTSIKPPLSQGAFPPLPALEPEVAL
jgi:hypothetical protein